MTTFKVHVSKDYTIFCSGHFITYEGNQCEPLHGHNYRASVTLEGELGPDSYVFNFVTLKRLLREACDRLDHRTLLPRDNPRLALSEEGTSIMARYRDKTYVLPREDVVILPISNTTAERLAEWLVGELAGQLVKLGRGLTAIEVEVEETFGQSALCRQQFSPP